MNMLKLTNKESEQLSLNYRANSQVSKVESKDSLSTMGFSDLPSLFVWFSYSFVMDFLVLCDIS